MLAVVHICSSILGLLLTAVKPALLLLDRFQKRQIELERLCDRIGLKYYDVVQTVKDMRCDAKRVTVTNLNPLKNVNVLLGKFNREAVGTLNTNSPLDVSIVEVRKKFGGQAAERISKIGNLFCKLDKEGKERDKRKFVCSSNVISISNAIVKEWDDLVSIMARKRFMRQESLTRELHEKAEGL